MILSDYSINTKYVNPLDKKPIAVEECLIDPRQFPFNCAEKFPRFEFVNANASGTTSQIVFSLGGFSK